MFKKNFACFTWFSAALCLAGSAYSQAAPAKTPAAAAVEGNERVNVSDYFAGLTFTGDQKAKIDEIRQDIKLRMDTVDKDEKLTPEQKGAMLDGYRRMEQRQIFAVLTPEQQTVVRQKLLARRAAEQEKKKQQQPAPK